MCMCVLSAPFVGFLCKGNRKDNHFGELSKLEPLVVQFPKPIQTTNWRLLGGCSWHPRLQIPTFFRVSCRPSTKKGCIYPEKPGFPKNALEKVGIWSRGQREVWEKHFPPWPGNLRLQGQGWKASGYRGLSRLPSCLPLLAYLLLGCG